jgi:hypothetical protein
MPLKAVAFDYSVLLGQEESVSVELRCLLEGIEGLGQKICVFSTHPRDVNGALRKSGLPTANCVVTQSMVGMPKGSHKWIEEAVRRLGIARHEIMYVGDEDRDFWTASNAAIFYLHAGWCGPAPEPGSGIEIPRVGAPRGVLRFASHFLARPPRWTYTLDVEERGVQLRCLADAGIMLPQSGSPGRFTLQDVLSRERDIRVGSQRAQTLLIMHALSSLSLEGLIPRNPIIAIYPSSKPGRTSAVIESFLRPASRFFHAYYKRDLLLRGVEALNTSDVRAAGKGNLVSFLTQANTVCVNREYEQLIRDNTIIMFDDFTTTGRSLEWARNLLYAAGAVRVILLTIGKYRYDHDVYVPTREVVSPFEILEYDHRTFSHTSYRMEQHFHNSEVLRESFELWKQGEPYL